MGTLVVMRVLSSVSAELSLDCDSSLDSCDVVAGRVEVVTTTVVDGVRDEVVCGAEVVWTTLEDVRTAEVVETTSEESESEPPDVSPEGETLWRRNSAMASSRGSATA
jgi:hypothetical protein